MERTAELQQINCDLRQSEARFRSLSESAPVGIFLTDRNGTYTNPRYQEIVGCSATRLNFA